MDETYAWYTACTTVGNHETGISAAMASRTRHDLVATTSPVDGLPRRQLSFIPVLTQSVAAVAPSGAAAVIPALLLTTVGGGTTLVAFACAALVTLLVCACLRPMARRMAVVGGIYSYVARGLGPRTAIVTGWSAIVGYASVSMAGLLAVGTYLSDVGVATGRLKDSPVALIVAIIVLAACVAALVMVRGIWISAWTTLLVESVSIVMLGALLTLLLVSTREAGTSFSSAMSFDGDLRGLALSVVVAISAFVGFESSTTLSRESRQPFRVVPRAIFYTPVFASVLYLLAVPVQAMALEGAPLAVLDSPTPLVELLALEGQQSLSVILDLGIATSFFACTLASLNALVRVLFTMGREGVAPALFGRAHLRFQTPSHAIVISMAVVSCGPVLMLLVGASPTQGLRAFLTLSACGYLGSYLAACLAAPALLRRIGESTPYVWVMSSIATAAMLLLAGGSIAFAWENSGSVLTVYGVIIALAVVYTGVLHLRAPGRLEAVGIYDETQRADLLWGESRR